MEARAHKNIRRLYLLAFAYMLLVMIPVLIPYLESLGLSMSEIYVLQACFGLVVAALEVPSGYLCDLWGRKPTVILGSLFYALGNTYFFFADSFFELILFEVILAVAISLVSGADFSMLYDWAQELDGSENKGIKVISNRQMITVSGEALAGLLSGILILYSFRHVLWVHMLCAWLPLWVALRLEEPPVKKRLNRDRHKENMREIWQHLFVKDRLLTWIFFNLAVWSLATFVAVWSYQKFWQEAGIPMAWFGLLWAAYNLLVGISGKLAPLAEQKLGSSKVLLLIALLSIGGYFGLSGAIGLWVVVLGLLFQVSRGLTQVLYQEAINRRTPSHFRATINSFSSLAFRLGFVLLGPLMGLAIDNYGLRGAFVLAGLCFSLALLGLLLPLLKQLSSELPLRQ